MFSSDSTFLKCMFHLNIVEFWHDCAEHRWYPGSLQSNWSLHTPSPCPHSLPNFYFISSISKKRLWIVIECRKIFVKNSFVFILSILYHFFWKDKQDCFENCSLIYILYFQTQNVFTEAKPELFGFCLHFNYRNLRGNYQ